MKRGDVESSFQDINNSEIRQSLDRNLNMFKKEF